MKDHAITIYSPYSIISSLVIFRVSEAAILHARFSVSQSIHSLWSIHQGKYELWRLYPVSTKLFEDNNRLHTSPTRTDTPTLAPFSGPPEFVSLFVCSTIRHLEISAWARHIYISNHDTHWENNGARSLLNHRSTDNFHLTSALLSLLRNNIPTSPFPQKRVSKPVFRIRQKAPTYIASTPAFSRVVNSPYTETILSLVSFPSIGVGKQCRQTRHRCPGSKSSDRTRLLIEQLEVHKKLRRHPGPYRTISPVS